MRILYPLEVLVCTVTMNLFNVGMDQASVPVVTLFKTKNTQQQTGVKWQFLKKYSDTTLKFLVSRRTHAQFISTLLKTAGQPSLLSKNFSPTGHTHRKNSQHYPGTFLIQQSLNKSSINQSTDEVRHEGDFQMPLLPLNFDTNTN